MIDENRRLILHFCEKDKAIMEHDRSGKLIKVHRTDRESPVLTDQNGQTLIGVRKRGATVFDRSRFLAALAETERDIAAKQAAYRASVASVSWFTRARAWLILLVTR